MNCPSLFFPPWHAELTLYLQYLPAVCTWEKFHSRKKPCVEWSIHRSLLIHLYFGGLNIKLSMQHNEVKQRKRHQEALVGLTVINTTSTLFKIGLYCYITQGGGSTNRIFTNHIKKKKKKKHVLMSIKLARHGVESLHVNF